MCGCYLADTAAAHLAVLVAGHIHVAAQQLLGIDEITEHSIRTPNGELVYDGYVHANKTGAYLPHAMQEVLEGTLGVFGDRLGRLLFKLVVEHNMTNHLLGGDVDMTRDEYSKMRGSSVREVAATHGNISFKDVLLFHQEE